MLKHSKDCMLFDIPIWRKLKPYKNPQSSPIAEFFSISLHQKIISRAVSQSSRTARSATPSFSAFLPSHYLTRLKHNILSRPIHSKANASPNSPVVIPRPATAHPPSTLLAYHAFITSHPFHRCALWSCPCRPYRIRHMSSGLRCRRYCLLWSSRLHLG